MMSEQPAAPVASNANAERRASLRYPCTLGGSSTEVAAIAPRDETHWPVTVCDISITGIALVVRRPFEPGTTLTLAFRDTSFKVEHTLHVRVVHLKPRSRSEWLIGCAFEQQLTADQVRALA